MPAILDAMRITTSSGAKVKAHPRKANRPKLGIKIPRQISPTGYSINLLFWKKDTHIVSATVNYTVNINYVIRFQTVKCKIVFENNIAIAAVESIFKFQF